MPSLANNVFYSCLLHNPVDYSVNFLKEVLTVKADQFDIILLIKQLILFPILATCFGIYASSHEASYKKCLTMACFVAETCSNDLKIFFIGI